MEFSVEDQTSLECHLETHRSEAAHFSSLWVLMTFILIYLEWAATHYFHQTNSEEVAQEAALVEDLVVGLVADQIWTLCD